MISSKFSTHRVSRQCQKNFLSPKMAAILNFQIFAKNGKHKFASISLTYEIERFRRNFGLQGTLTNYSLQFSKSFLSPKMAAILNFEIFAKNGTHKFASISLTCEIERFLRNFGLQGTLANYSLQFLKSFLSSKMRPF